MASAAGEPAQLAPDAHAHLPARAGHAGQRYQPSGRSTYVNRQPAMISRAYTS